MSLSCKYKYELSVIIKTFNEEANIGATIDSIRSNIHDINYEIIVADSLSLDATQQIALDRDVKVVTLNNADERCCGVGHQLGYLVSEGKYLLLLDGDMQLETGFIESAIKFLDDNQKYAAVAGAVEMDDSSNYEFKARKQKIAIIYPFGDVNHLGGGGLYRSSAIDEIGYLTNRNLHALEEGELGLRLTSAGYKLHRLDIPYFKHTSYELSTLELLKHRWNNGYLFSHGELLKSAYGKPYFMRAVKLIKSELVFTAYVMLVLLVLVFGGFSDLLISLLPLVAFWALKSLKNKSMQDGFMSILNLSSFSAGIIRGLLTPIKDPKEKPSYTILPKDE